MRTKAMLMLVLLGSSFCFVQAAAAATPREIARRCVVGIDSEVAAALDQMEHICRRTVEVIRERMREGDEDGARIAAREGIARLTGQVQRSGLRIESGARRCIAKLKRVGAKRAFVRAIRGAVESAADDLLGARRSCMEVILEALR